MNVDKWAWCGQVLTINGPDAVIVLNRPRMGHVMVYCTGWVLDRAPGTKETFSDFVKLWILVMGHNGVVSSYTKSTGIPRLMGDQQTLGF